VPTEDCVTINGRLFLALRVSSKSYLLKDLDLRHLLYTSMFFLQFLRA